MRDRPLSASEVLKRHVRERHLSMAIVDGDPNQAEPRMSEAAWVESCLAVRGVPEATLRLLTAFYCQHDGWDLREVLVEIQGQKREVAWGRVSVPLTLAQAATRAGLGIDRSEARALQLEAIQRVQENLVRRAVREERAA